jgi:hypothetical protein
MLSVSLLLKRNLLNLPTAGVSAESSANSESVATGTDPQ